MISTGKTGHAKSGHVGTLLMSGQHQVKGSTSKRAVSHGDGHTIAGQSDQEHKMTAFNVSGHKGSTDGSSWDKKLFSHSNKTSTVYR